MMRKKDNINYYKNDYFAAVSLPFGDGTYNLSILLPNVPFDLPRLLDNLDSESWDTMRKGFVNQKVKLSIPIFSTEYSKQMLLSGLGMKGLNSDDGTLRIGQSTLFMMDEDGAAAAAVTQTGLRSIIHRQQPLPLHDFRDRLRTHPLHRSVFRRLAIIRTIRRT